MEPSTIGAALPEKFIPQWTKDPPRAPGWYWVIEPEGAPQVVAVTSRAELGEPVLVVVTRNDWYYPRASLGWWWSLKPVTAPRPLPNA